MKKKEMTGVELDEAVASTLLRVSCLEKILIDKEIISKEEYIKVLQEAAGEFKKITQQMIAEVNSNNQKMLS